MNLAFKIIEHPADLGIEAFGSSMKDVFRNSAFGLMSVIAGDSKIDALLEHRISLSGLDRENLLVRWLSEILFLYDAEKILTSDIMIEGIGDTSLEAVVYGERYNPSKHQLKLDVKAVTYHQLIVEEKKNNWMVRVFLDI